MLKRRHQLSTVDQPGRWPPPPAFEEAVPFPQDTLVLGGAGVGWRVIQGGTGVFWWHSELTTDHTVSTF